MDCVNITNISASLGKKLNFRRLLTNKIWSLVTRKMTLPTERAFWLVIGEAMLFKGLIFAALFFNVLAAMLEGLSVAAMALGVSSIVSADAAACAMSFEWLSVIGLDNVCSNVEKSTLFLWCLSIAVAGQITRAIFQYIGVVFAAYLQTNVVGSLQKKVVAQLMSLGYENKSLYSAGEQQAYIGQAALTATLVNVINTLVMNFLVFAFYLVILMSMSWKLSVGAFTVVVLLLIVVFPFLSKIQQIGKRILKTGVALAKQTVEYLQASRLVRVYGKEKFVSSRMHKLIDDGLKARREGIVVQGLLAPLQESISIIAGVVFLAGGFYFSKQPLEQVLPLLMAYVLVLYRSMGRLSSVNIVRSGIAKATPAAEFVAELLRKDNKTLVKEEGEIALFEKSGLSVKNLDYQYQASEELVLKQIDLHIDMGKVYAFVGPSGSGKTTLVDLILGLYEPMNGSVKMGNVSLVEALPSSWMNQFAVVSQHDLILNDTVMNNLLFAKEGATHEEVVNACKAAQAHDFILSMESGYETILGERGNKLSGGQMQRLALARALLREAPILILDEATSALDTASEKLIMESVLNLRQSKSILMIAHRLSTVVDADTIFVMQEGQIVDSGTHMELILREGLYQDLWTIQTNQPSQTNVANTN